jgi:hypothetical protein
MTKTQKQKEVIKRFLSFVEEVFPQYEIDDYGDGGRITFFPTEGENDDAIEFQRSRLDLCILNHASPQAKEDCMVMEGMLNVIQKELEDIEA